MIYNGVTMRVEQATIEENAWYSSDGKDLLGTHFVIRSRNLWHPFATSNAGAVAMTSIAALRQTLMTPRKQLEFSMPASGTLSSSTLLRSPYNIPVGYVGAGTAFPSDSNNGPCPIYCNVQPFGERAAIVEYAIETWLTECADVRPVLSHRWEISHVIDRDYFTTRIVRGTVVFRAEWVEYWNSQLDDNPSYLIGADLYRSQLFPSIPFNFKRDYVNVNITPDGLTMTYEIHDVEVPSNVDPAIRRKITRVEGTYTESEGVVSLSPAAWVSAAGSFAAVVASGGMVGVGDTINALNGAVGGLFPMISVQLDLQVWGRRTATKDDLIFALMAGVTAFNFNGPGSAILNNIVNFATGLTARALFNTAMFTIDLVNQTARFQGKAEFPSLAASTLRAFGLMPGGAGIAAGGFPNQIAGLTTWNTNDTQGPGAENQSRSIQFLQRAVTAAIKSPCDVVVRPQY